MSEISTIKLLAQNNYVIFNKEIANKIGIEAAILLGTLCSYQNSFKLQEFYKEETELAKDTALTIYSIRKAKKILEENGKLKITKKGLPAKHYFYIITSGIENLITSSDKIAITSGVEIATTSGNENITTGSDENITTINNINNSNKYNNNNNYNYIYNNSSSSDEIINFIEDNFGRTLSSYEFEKINCWLNEFNSDIVKHAIELSILNNKRTFAYIEGILKNWKSCGYKTLDDIKNEDVTPKHKTKEELKKEYAKMGYIYE